MSSKDQANGESPSWLIDARIKELDDWRGKTLSHIRALIKQAVPEVVEEWKWRGVPVWYHNGMICAGETYKSVVKVTFAQGARIPGPIAPLQFQPERQYATGDRHPRRGEGRRGRVQGAREGRGGSEWPAGEETVDPEVQFDPAERRKAAG